MIVTKTVEIKTKGNGDIIDISEDISRIIADCTFSSGIASIFISGSTAGITTIEYEPGLVADLKHMWERLIPQNMTYEHNNRWGDGNGFSHIRASLLGPSLTVPFAHKKLMLGTWQQIVIVEFDNRSRSRVVNIQLLGE